MEELRDLLAGEYYSDKHVCEQCGVIAMMPRSLAIDIHADDTAFILGSVTQVVTVRNLGDQPLMLSAALAIGGVPARARRPDPGVFEIPADGSIWAQLSCPIRKQPYGLRYLRVILDMGGTIGFAARRCMFPPMAPDSWQ